MSNLLKNVKIQRVMNAVAAGTSNQTSSAVDTQGFDGVMFVASFGTLTATQVTSLKAQTSSDDGASDAYDDLAGTLVGPMTDADSNKQLILDIYKPRKRYLKAVVNRATANAVIDGVTAILYRGRKAPVTQPSASVSASEQWVSPAEGTA
jgi:hypothetical protein